MKKILFFRFLCFLFCLSPLCLKAQSGYAEYIALYKELAIDQMKRHGIPASITLAQALLESGAGKSSLAVLGNNHFGIKVGSNWTGEYLLRDDDERNERFRKYTSVEQSYEDHSLFLKRPRYAQLFSLSMTDYKGWAKGLKAAGYATNPAYATHLINIIERYDLTRFDLPQSADVLMSSRVPSQPSSTSVDNLEMVVRRCNNNYYVVAREDDTYASISRTMDISEKKLRKYNEVNKKHPLKRGDIVYLEKKRKKADRRLKGKIHYIQAGESLHSIAQQYGMRIKTLYQINKLSSTYTPIVGQSLRIR